MSDELQPCPFCGGEAEYEGLYCYCLRCECRMADNPDEADAIAAWNRRSSPSVESVRRMREALEKIRDHWATHYDHPNANAEMYRGPYGIGVVDGHRECARLADEALAALSPTDGAPANPPKIRTP